MGRREKAEEIVLPWDAEGNDDVVWLGDAESTMASVSWGKRWTGRRV